MEVENPLMQVPQNEWLQLVTTTSVAAKSSKQRGQLHTGASSEIVRSWTKGISLKYADVLFTTLAFGFGGLVTAERNRLF
jgi:hypothetical protein